MSNPSPQYIASNTGAVFAQLQERDIEEFYIGYQRWNLQHQLEILQTQLEDLRKQISVNTERMQEVHPTAIELATLARLQSNGVSDIDLLDRMLEQGELWLDHTMQRLDYLEQLDGMISDDYTQWCQHALEGAYDWIDSVLDTNPTSLPPATAPEEDELIEATEDLFLQKISIDEYEDEPVTLETTMKRPSMTIADLEESIPSSDATDITSDQENASLVQETVEVSPVTEEPTFSPPKTSLENVSRKRPNFIRRFFGKIWRS